MYAHTHKANFRSVNLSLICGFSPTALATLKPQAAGYMAPGAERVCVIHVHVYATITNSQISLFSSVQQPGDQIQQAPDTMAMETEVHVHVHVRFCIYSLYTCINVCIFKIIHSFCQKCVPFRLLLVKFLMKWSKRYGSNNVDTLYTVHDLSRFM